MRLDNFTRDKDGLDYARVLVATSSLDVINVYAKVVVDGVLLYFKIIKEWGFTLGEDAHSDMVKSHEAFDGRREVDEFLKHILEDYHEEGHVGGVSNSFDKRNVSQGNGSSANKKNVGNGSSANFEKDPNHLFEVSAIPLINVGTSLPSKSSIHNNEGEQPVHVAGASVDSGKLVIINVLGENHGDASVSVGGGSRRDRLLQGPRIIQRTTSCPPGRGRSANSGPWSLDFLKSQKLVGERGDLTSNKNVTFNSTSTSGPHVNKQKGAGYLRHTAQSMRHIARLPAKDRSASQS